jgi:hypothetical protein
LKSIFIYHKNPLPSREIGIVAQTHYDAVKNYIEGNNFCQQLFSCAVGQICLIYHIVIFTPEITPQIEDPLELTTGSKGSSSGYMPRYRLAV